MFSSLAQALAIDYTFFIQFTVFLICYPVFSRLLFYPYVQLQNLRDKETKERMKQVEKWEEKRKILQEQYEQKVRDINEGFNRLYNEGSVRLKEDFFKKKREVQEKIQKGYEKERGKLKEEVEEARRSLKKETNQLVTAAVHRLVS
ncbi:MAG: hypothetical protein OXM55_08845 [Bdellovibrionales bacterium]|nr:hypothetical protein [Bdellovibrionales bacterium]